MNLIKKFNSFVCSSLFCIISCFIFLIVGFIIKSSVVEIFASITALLSVWLLSKEKVSNFIFGISASLSYLYIYYVTGLYAMAVLSIFQTIFNIYGWYYWVKNANKENHITITSGLTKKGQFIWLAIILIAWAIWGYIQINILYKQNMATDSLAIGISLIDSLAAVIGLIAQYWLSKKLYENWILWIISNIIYMVIYISKDLYVMLILAVIQLFLSIAGLVEWYSSYKEQGKNKLTF